MQTLSGLQEMLSYYHLDFNIYILAAMAVALHTIKAVKFRKTERDRKLRLFDLAASALLLVGMFSGLVFQGALLDISPETPQVWVVRLASLCILCLALFAVQIGFAVKKTNR